jgi:methionine sulfoxide reductase heme-binding subunit
VIDPGEHLFWIASRAAGVTALVLASLSVAVGVCMGTRWVRGRRATDAKTLHEVLSLATLVSLAVHALSLLGDAYLRPSVFDIAIPFVSDYKTVWMSLGIVAGWSMAALGLSYYARARIGHARWRSAHRFTSVVWILGIVHALAMGTDAGTPWFLAALALTAGPALALLLARIAGAIPTTRTPSNPVRSPA